jgi:cytochrome P450
MSDAITGTLVDPETRRCPYDLYSQLREKAPVYKMTGTDFYFVANYELAVKVLQDRNNYSNEMPAGETSFVNYCPEADRLLAEKGYGRRVKTVVFSDPPVHTAYRKLLSNFFRPSVMSAMEPKVRVVMGSLLKDIPHDGVHDVVQALLVPLPMYVIADWLGVQREDYLSFKKWSLAANYTLQPPLPKEKLLGYAETIAEMQHYLVGMMAKRRAEPRDDLITGLLQAKLNDEVPLTDKEILSVLETLLVAGNETTTNAIGNGLLALAKDPTLQLRLRSELDKIPRFVEEVLRSQSSVTGVWRLTKHDVELGGVKIPKASKVFVGVASANRDERQFEHADQVDYDRPNLRSHVGFGTGFHSCLGNPLARVEMQVFFEMFLKEFERFSLAIAENEVPYYDLMGLRGLSALPLNLVRAKQA